MKKDDNFELSLNQLYETFDDKKMLKKQTKEIQKDLKKQKEEVKKRLKKQQEEILQKIKDFLDENDPFCEGTFQLNKYGIEGIIEFIEKGENLYWLVPSKEEKADDHSSHYEYDVLIMRLFKFIPYIPFADEYIEKFINNDINSLTLEQVIEYLTFIYRKESFINGHIAHYIDNGILLQLLKRLLEVC